MKLSKFLKPGTDVFRLVKEPRRLWRRYLTNNPRFVARIFRRPPRALHMNRTRTAGRTGTEKGVSP